MKRVCVTGAAGFIGGHLCRYLKEQGYWVRGVDIVQPRYGDIGVDEFMQVDLRNYVSAAFATSGVDWIFGLAADMGGMGFIADDINQAGILWHNTLINFHTLAAATINGVERYFYSSSACMYPVELQGKAGDETYALKEEDAYPAMPQKTYGWEKLQMEHLAWEYGAAYPIETRMARYHAIYGPQGAWRGGREKAPAALCRKVAEAKIQGRDYIEIWGDGEATRTFLYVDDCVRGTLELLRSDYPGPLNIGSDEVVSINQLADIIIDVAGMTDKIRKVYVPGPMGVRGRSADLTRVKAEIGWEPTIQLREGIERTYAWIEKQIYGRTYISSIESR